VSRSGLVIAAQCGNKSAPFNAPANPLNDWEGIEGLIYGRATGQAGYGGMLGLLRKVLVFSIVLLSVVMLWPLWPSQHYRDLSLSVSIRPLLILAAVYGLLAFADFIRRQ
jgi:hypothetical protein